MFCWRTPRAPHASTLPASLPARRPLTTPGPLQLLPRRLLACARQARTDLQATIKRVKESEARIDAAIAPSVEKAYW